MARRDGARVWLRFDPGRVRAAELIAAVCARLPVTDLSVADVDLEAVIRRIYEEREGSGRAATLA